MIDILIVLVLNLALLVGSIYILSFKVIFAPESDSKLIVINRYFLALLGVIGLYYSIVFGVYLFHYTFPLLKYV